MKNSKIILAVAALSLFINAAAASAQGLEEQFANFPIIDETEASAEGSIETTNTADQTTNESGSDPVETEATKTMTSEEIVEVAKEEVDNSGEEVVDTTQETNVASNDSSHTAAPAKNTSRAHLASSGPEVVALIALLAAAAVMQIRFKKDLKK